MCTWKDLGKSVYVYAFLECASMCIYVCECVYVCEGVYMCASVCICVGVSIYVCSSVCMCVRVCRCVLVYSSESRDSICECANKHEIDKVCV